MRKLSVTVSLLHQVMIESVNKNKHRLTFNFLAVRNRDISMLTQRIELDL